MLASTSAMSGPVEHGGSLFTKSAKAKANGPVACVYLTVTAPRPEKTSLFKTDPNFEMSIKNTASDVKYGASVLRFLAVGGFMAEIKLPEEYGETYEACLVPGDYEIEAIAFGDAGVVFTPKRFEPIHFSLKAEDSLYLGNLYLNYSGGRPVAVVVRDRLERDQPFLVKEGKHRLRNSIHASLLDPGNNSAMVKEGQ